MQTGSLQNCHSDAIRGDGVLRSTVSAACLEVEEEATPGVRSLIDLRPHNPQSHSQSRQEHSLVLALVLGGNHRRNNTGASMLRHATGCLRRCLTFQTTEQKRSSVSAFGSSAGVGLLAARCGSC